MPGAANKQTPTTPKRVRRDGTFHVFKLIEGHWSHLTKTAVIASSRKDAIRKVTASMEDKTGTFMVIVEREFKPITRKVEQRVEDIFE